MIDLYNDNFEIEEIVEESINKYEKIENNIIYIYFDEIENTMKVENLTKEYIDIKNINILIENISKHNFLNEIKEELLNINKDNVYNEELTNQYLSVKNLFNIDKEFITAISGNRGIGGTNFGINTADLTLCYIAKNNIENIDLIIQNKINYFLNNIRKDILDEKKVSFSLFEKEKKHYLKQNKNKGELILEDVCEIENIETFSNFLNIENINIISEDFVKELENRFNSILEIMNNSNEKFSFTETGNSYEINLNKENISLIKPFRTIEVENFREFISKNKTLKLLFIEEIKKIYNENNSNIIILNIPGVKNVFNLKKSHNIIEKYKDIIEKGYLILKNINCKICTKTKETGFTLKKFIDPSDKKVIQKFNLTDSKIDVSGFICEDCFEKIKEINKKLNGFNYAYLNRTSNTIKPLKNVRDLFTTKTEEIGGALYSIEKSNNGLKNFKFLFTLNTTDTARKILKRLNQISELLNGNKLKNTDIYFQDIFYFNELDMKSVKEDLTKDFLDRARFVKSNFYNLLMFVLNGNKLPLFILNDLQKIYMNNSDKLKNNAYLLTGLFNDFENSKSLVNINNLDTIFNITGGEKMLKDIIETTKIKLIDFSHDKENKIELNEMETIFIAGKLIRELNNLSKSKDKNLGYFKTINKSNKGIARHIKEAFNKYSHEISNTRNTQIIAQVIENLENIKIKRIELETLFTIGFLNTSIKILYTKNKTQEEK